MGTPTELDQIDSRVSGEATKHYRQRLLEYQMVAKKHWDFEIVPGFFKQSEEGTKDGEFDYLAQGFGRLQLWQAIFQQLNQLNRDSGPGTRYKVLFLARHGQGVHNVAHAKYGDDDWNGYWSKINGDGVLVWGPDPELTDLGRQQARDNAEQWKRELDRGCLVPQRWFVSPFSRAIDTLLLTWKDIVDIAQVQPVIKEKVRETIGVHTCDKRSTRTVIENKYCGQGLVIEPGFAEDDIYFKDDYRETVDEQAIRIYDFFQDVFECPDQIVSVTSHSGSIRASLLVFNHRPFAVGTGAMIPVFVKATLKTH